jgi:large subunit ribosomal protein L29
MKPSEIRDMGAEDMQRKVKELKEELFNLRFQHEIGQLENSRKMVKTKRDIARVYTILRETQQTKSK